MLVTLSAWDTTLPTDPRSSPCIILKLIANAWMHWRQMFTYDENDTILLTQKHRTNTIGHSTYNTSLNQYRRERSYENADDIFSSTYLPHPFNSSSEMEDVLQMEILTTRLPRNTVHRFDNSIEAKVEPGDTLQAIALRFHCSIADIKRLNKIDKENEIHAHKVIKIPVTVHNVLLDNFPIVHTSGNSSPKIVKTTDGSYSNQGSPGSSSGLSSLIRNPLQENEAILSEKLMVASVNASTAVSSSKT
uniref:LysM domain-containing protein n=1 Tax=Glossina austeni TaxID=7395 RepID=A0A1A9VX37_GLOAU